MENGKQEPIPLVLASLLSPTCFIFKALNRSAPQDIQDISHLPLLKVVEVHRLAPSRLEGSSILQRGFLNKEIDQR